MTTKKTMFTKKNATTGNRTRVTCVTGRYTNRYTIATVDEFCTCASAIINRTKAGSSFCRWQNPPRDNRGAPTGRPLWIPKTNWSRSSSGKLVVLQWRRSQHGHGLTYDTLPALTVPTRCDQSQRHTSYDLTQRCQRQETHLSLSP